MDMLASIFGSGIIGSIVGGLFRLAPEVLKALDKKDERAHELRMFERQVELEKARGQIKLDEIGAQHKLAVDTGAMAALKAAIDQQTELASKAGGKIAALSASVRPVVTYAIVGVYLGMQIAMALQAENAKEAFALVMTPDFVALVCGILNYYFLNRTFERRSI